MHIRTTAVTALVFGCTLFALLSITGVAQPGTLTVGPGGQFSGIQAAVNAASPGDTIVVYSGTYRENVDVNKRLNLIGEDTGEGKPVVDAGMAGNALLLTADGVHVFGLALTGSSYKNAGIKAVSSNNLIEDCDLYDNYNGIYLFHSSDNVVISNCAYGNSYDGINLNYSCNNRILNNDLSGNAHDGLRIEEYSHGNLVEGNNVTDNARSSVETESKNAITVYMSDGNVVQGNVMKGNGGIVVRESGTYRLGDGVMAMDTRGTIVRNNTMEDNHYAVWIYHSADATVAGNVAAGHYYCVVVEDSSDVMVADNVLSRGGRDARIIGSTNVTFRNNTMFGGIFDMSIDDSNYCTIDNNVLYDSKHDTLLVSNSNHNRFVNNTIVCNSGYGLNIISSNDNDLFLNNFMNGEVASSDSINRWASTSVISYKYGSGIFTGYLGNNWGNYNGQDADGNGIGDSKYAIDSQNVDPYPLIGTNDKYISPPPKISISPTTRPSSSPAPEVWDDLWTFIVHIFDILRSL